MAKQSTEQTMVTYRMPAELIDSIRYLCRASELKQTVHVRRALEEYCETHAGEISKEMSNGPLEDR